MLLVTCERPKPSLHLTFFSTKFCKMSSKSGHDESIPASLVRHTCIEHLAVYKLPKVAD